MDMLRFPGIVAKDAVLIEETIFGLKNEIMSVMKDCDLIAIETSDPSTILYVNAHPIVIDVQKIILIASLLSFANVKVKSGLPFKVSYYAVYQNNKMVDVSVFRNIPIIEQVINNDLYIYMDGCMIKYK